jgi:putative folate metabolism gamma-glutamate ligase
MIVTPLKTHKITKKDTSILTILDRYLVGFKNKSVLAVTSKIVSISEGRIVPVGKMDKDVLIKRESDYYIERNQNQYGFAFTLTNNLLIATAGIDESNGNGNYVLWPKDPYKSANEIREYLVKRFKIRHAGVIIVDSHTMPFKWGLTGISIAHSGFTALKDLIGTPDIFGRNLHVTKQSIVDGLSASASLVMGEANEQTPLAVITDVPFIIFNNRNLTRKEIADLKISPEEDLYWPLMKHAPWKKGKSKV